MSGRQTDDALHPPLRRAVLRVHRWLAGPPLEGDAPRYVLVRFAILRLLGLVYFVAFLGAVHELVPLIGAEGLLPAADYLAAVEAQLGDEATTELPTLFWLDASDDALLAVSIAGLVLSAAVMLGVTQAGVMLVLWALYLSIDHVGQRWFSFGWETQLLETGLLAALMCPWRSLRPLPPRSPPSRIAIGLMRWLAFRIMLGAGLIKWRGDPCWRELTCLHSHFETQPIPGPLSAWFHHLPDWMLSGGVVFNHAAELVLPLFVFGPRRLRLAAGIGFVAFQGTLILSGNLSFLNWLTLVPCLACLDDRFVRACLPAGLRRRWDAWLARPDLVRKPSRATTVTAGLYAVVVAWLSLPVVLNLAGMAGHQAMNRSYDRLHLVNTYGAFGSVGAERFELEIEGTLDDPRDPNAGWQAYAFPCKPGDPHRRPCWITPYHRRLDWLMWFAALDAAATGGLQREVWVLRLLDRLLRADPAVLGLLADDPFDGARPRAVRVVLWRYRFADPEADAVWRRQRLGTLIRPVTLDDPAFIEALQTYGWR